VKKTVAFVVALLILFGCNHSKPIELSLKLDNAEGQSVFLRIHIDDNTDAVIDSSVISGKTTVLTAPNDDPQTLYIIKFNKNDHCGIYTFFTENQNTTITGNRDDMPHWTVKGCPSMDILMAHHEESMKLYEEPIMAAYMELEEAGLTGDTVKFAETNDQIQLLIKEYLIH